MMSDARESSPISLFPSSCHPACNSHHFPALSGWNYCTAAELTQACSRAAGADFTFLPVKRLAPMKIAQIAPLMESVPPRLYGGTERVVSYLTEELVAQGHEVTLFASADSVTSARLVGCATTALRLDPNVVDHIPYYMLMLDKVRRLETEFDILHFHIDYLHFPLFRGLAGRTVTTLHGRQDLPDNKAIFIEFDDMPLVSISASQR